MRTNSDGPRHVAPGRRPRAASATVRVHPSPRRFHCRRAGCGRRQGVSDLSALFEGQPLSDAVRLRTSEGRHQRRDDRPPRSLLARVYLGQQPRSYPGRRHPGSVQLGQRRRRSRRAAPASLGLVPGREGVQVAHWATAGRPRPDGSTRRSASGHPAATARATAGCAMKDLRSAPRKDLDLLSPALWLTGATLGREPPASTDTSAAHGCAPGAADGTRRSTCCLGHRLVPACCPVHSRRGLRGMARSLQRGVVRRLRDGIRRRRGTRTDRSVLVAQ